MNVYNRKLAVNKGVYTYAYRMRMFGSIISDCAEQFVGPQYQIERPLRALTVPPILNYLLAQVEYPHIPNMSECRVLFPEIKKK
jgi:hypothetical protein